MNAITIQKRADGNYLVTAPGTEPLIFEDAYNVGEMLTSAVPALEPEIAREGHGGTTIPERLENQSKMIRGFAERLKCPPVDSAIKNAIGNLIRDSAWNKHRLGEMEKQLAHFDGVTVERNAANQITRITAKNTIERPGNGIAVITFDEQNDTQRRTELHGVVIERDARGHVTSIAFQDPEAGHDSKTPQPETQHAGAIEVDWKIMEQIIRSEVIKVIQREKRYDGALYRSDVMTSTREPRISPSMSAAKQIMHEAREMYYDTQTPTKGDAEFLMNILRIIEEFTGHKEAVLAELRTLWESRTTRRPSGAAIIRRGAAERIEKLLSTFPAIVFPKPDETWKQRKETLEQTIRELLDERMALNGKNVQLQRQLDEARISIGDAARATGMSVSHG